MKLAKVRTTNYRPPAAGASSPLERRGATRGGSVDGMDGLDHLWAAQTAEAANADAWVSGYDNDTLRGIARDLGGERVWDRKDPIQRWKMARKAAVLRRLAGIPAKN
jgi:hypothetical protein